MKTVEEKQEQETKWINDWLEKHPKVRDESKFVEIAVNGQTGHMRGSDG